jgi:hypothetical protein
MTRRAERGGQLNIFNDIMTAIACCSTALLLALIADQLFFGATISEGLF